MVDPARLAWGLKRVCLDYGVRIHEHTQVIGSAGDRLRPHGRAGRRASRRPGDSAFPPLVRAIRPYVLPVYDYALVTEPLSAEQRDAVGWHDRQGLGDAGNQFHYYRLTEDDRILWGGYDAIYHWATACATSSTSGRDVREAGRHFFATFPQLEGLRFTHKWGGAIDTCSRFSAFWGTAQGGRAAYAVGYTGLGVGASRFGAKVMLDLLRASAPSAPSCDGQDQAAPVPARAAAQRGGQPDALVAGAGRCERGQAQRLAAHARPPGPGLRQLAQLAVRAGQLARLLGHVELLQRRVEHLLHELQPPRLRALLQQLLLGDGANSIVAAMP